MTAVIQNCNNRVIIEPDNMFSGKIITESAFLKRVNLELENFRSTENITIFLNGTPYTVKQFQNLLK